MTTITSPRSESPAISIPRIQSPSIGSASETPTSSVRPSTELPRNPSPAPAQRRNRAALRDYYNLKSRGGSQDSTPASRTTSIASIPSNASESTITSATASGPAEASTLTAQLDEPSFDAEDYVSQLLKTATLREILRTESALVSEVKNLDGERKALVYDNYSKLIKAVGTIADMQKGMHSDDRWRQPRLAGVRAVQQHQPTGLDEVGKLGEKLDGLVKVIEELRPTEAGAASTKQHVDARQKRRQKDLVRWALDSPIRIQTLASQGHAADATNEYHRVCILLEKWHGVGGVDALRKRCDEAMSGIKLHEESEEPNDSV